MPEAQRKSILLTICAGCKKVRDDKGEWNEIESHFKRQSEARFSHSICPDCVKKLYPEIEIIKSKLPSSPRRF